MTTLVNSALASFSDSSIKSTIQNGQVRHFQDALKSIERINPYAVPPAAALKLESLGIGTSPFAINLHTHSATKAIENRLLQVVDECLPTEPVTFMMIKPAKVASKFHRPAPINMDRPKRVLDPRKDQIRNGLIEPKDVSRYPAWTLTKALGQLTTRVAYISDTLHFWSPDDLCGFFDANPRLQTLYATMVLPVEAKHGHPSLHPELYSLNYHGEHFEYLPSGQAGAAYVHAKSTLQWLDIGKLVTPRYVISAQKIETLGANHLFCYTRGDLLVPHSFVYAQDDLVTLPQLFAPPTLNVLRPYKKTMMMQLFLYVKSVKQATPRDIFAKIRQIVKTSDLHLYDMKEFVHLENYFCYLAQLSHDNDNPNLLKGNWITAIWANLRSEIRRKLTKWVAKSQFEQLMTLTELIPFTYSQVTRTHTCTTPVKPAPVDNDEPVAVELPEDQPVAIPATDLDEDLRTPGLWWDQLHADGPTPPPSFHSTPSSPPVAPIQLAGAIEDFFQHAEALFDVKVVRPAVYMTMAEIDWQQQPDGKNDLATWYAPADITTSTLYSTDTPHDALPSTAHAYDLGDWPADFRTHTWTHFQVYQPPVQHADDDVTYEEPAEEGPWKRFTDAEEREYYAAVAPWADILRAHGVQEWSPQYGLLNPLEHTTGMILPITDVKKVEAPIVPRRELPNPGIADVLASVRRNTFKVPVDARRANAYTNDLKNNRTGALLRDSPVKQKQAWDSMTEHYNGDVYLTVIEGAGGSGKSHALQEYMRSLHTTTPDIVVVLPTVELRNDWLNKVPNVAPETFKTYEKAFVQKSASVVIFDDAGKLPDGYLEAYFVTRQACRHGIVTWDHRQSVFHETNEAASIAQLPSAVDFYNKYSEFYLNFTHRNLAPLANALGVYGTRQGEVVVDMVTRPVEGQPILVPSRLKKSTYADIGHRSFTYAGCQGLTAPKVNVVVDSHTFICSSRVLYTALSRAVDELNFISTYTDVEEFNSKMDCTPYLKTFLMLVIENNPTFVEPPSSPEPTPVEPPVTHLPVDPAMPILEAIADEMGDKHDREIYSTAHGHSNAVQTEDPVVQLHAHQQSSDESLYWATIDKRLAISTPEDNLKELADKMPLGDVLFENYARAMGLPAQPIEFDEELWINCAAEVEKTYTQKNVAALINGQLRQSPDFDEAKIALFLKSQWVKKSEKLGALKIKPGQTIASFMQETVMLFGTMARYMRRVRERYQPDNIFINSERTNEQLDSFVAQQWKFNRPAFTNDYESFDQSQDGGVLAMEVVKARFHSIPKAVIDAYISIKCCAYIFLGVLAIMRLSGEGPTFDANTETNIAYFHTRFAVPEGTAQVYGGDDMACDDICPEKPSFQLIADKLKLTGKPIISQQRTGDWPGFCGWLFTPRGIVKDPLKLYASLELGARIGKAQALGRSYAMDIDYTYRLGDGIYDILDEEQQRLHWSALRMLIKDGYKPASLHALDSTFQPGSIPVPAPMVPENPPQGAHRFLDTAIPLRQLRRLTKFYTNQQA